MNNLYEILSVGSEATLEEIKKAFRKLSLQHHPDKTNGDSEIFHQLNKAYKILIDPDLR